MRAARRGAAAGAGALALALAARLVCGSLPLNYYDTAFALIWGRELDRGHLPHLHVQAASTPHPLATVAGALAAAFGTAASWDVVQALLFVAYGVGGVALFALARAFLPVPGAVLAAGALLLSPPFLTSGLGGSGLADLPALALTLCAAALVAHAPRRAVTPLVLLALAGLLRPEAWGLAAAYAVWLLAVRARPPALIVALVLAAPAVWIGGDVLIAGDGAYSLTHTQAAVPRSSFEAGLGSVPRVAAHDLRALIGLPVLVAGCLGALLALASGTRRAAAVPLALLGLALLEFGALGVARVPLVARFLLLAAAMFALFFGYAVTRGRGDLLRRRSPNLRRVGAPAITIAALLLVAAVGVSDVRRIGHIRADQRVAVHAEEDLLALAHSDRMQAAIRDCGAPHAPRFTMISLIAYDFDLPVASIQRTRRRPPTSGLVLAPVGVAAGRQFGLTAPRLRELGDQTLRPFTLLLANRSWRVYARACAGLRTA